MTFIPFKGQSFESHAAWVARARYVLTAHPEYHNTEHDGPAKGWRGPHFTALCFDQKGRRVRSGGDFARAKAENAFPVWWIWPDQIAELLMPPATYLEATEALATAMLDVVQTADNEDGAPVEHWRKLAAEAQSLIDHGASVDEVADAKALYDGAKLAGLIM